jgi:hypothetical protein
MSARLSVSVSVSVSVIPSVGTGGFCERDGETLRAVQKVKTVRLLRAVTREVPGLLGFGWLSGMLLGPGQQSVERWKLIR